MIKSSEIKKTALSKINWKIAILLSVTFSLANIALNCALEFVDNLTVNLNIFRAAANVIYIALLLPLSFGFISSISKLYKSEKVTGTTIFNEAVLNFSKVIGIFIRTVLKILLPVIIIVAATLGIIFFTLQAIPVTNNTLSGYYIFIFIAYIFVTICILITMLPYVLTSYILSENKEMSAEEIVLRSEALMDNNKWNFVKLILSFFIWLVLLAIVAALFGMWLGELAQTIVSWVGMVVILPYLVTSIRVFYEETLDTNA